VFVFVRLPWASPLYGKEKTKFPGRSQGDQDREKEGGGRKKKKVPGPNAELSGLRFFLTSAPPALQSRNCGAARGKKGRGGGGRKKKKKKGSGNHSWWATAGYADKYRNLDLHLPVKMSCGRRPPKGGGEGEQKKKSFARNRAGGFNTPPQPLKAYLFDLKHGRGEKKERKEKKKRWVLEGLRWEGVC